MTVKKIRVVLADDHAMVRQGLAQLLDDSGQIEVVGQAGDGQAAVELAEGLSPDVIVLDYTMPILDGVAALEEIRRRCPKIRILILTVHENIHYAVKVLEAGAHGFVVKAGAAHELVQGIFAVHGGRIYVSPSISEKLVANIAGRKSRRSGLEALSKREFELLRFLGSGMRIQDCARLMRVTESTVSTYRSRLLQKLKLSSTAELIRFALENGIIG